MVGICGMIGHDADSATLPGGTRLSDYLGVDVMARVHPPEKVRSVVQSLDCDSRRRRDLPAEVMVYFVIAMARFRSVSAREILRCLVSGLRWVSPDTGRGYAAIPLWSRAVATGAELPRRLKGNTGFPVIETLMTGPDAV